MRLVRVGDQILNLDQLICATTLALRCGDDRPCYRLEFAGGMAVMLDSEQSRALDEMIGPEVRNLSRPSVTLAQGQLVP